MGVSALGGVLQVTAENAEPASGGILALVGTIVVATIFYGITLHIAARYVLERVSIKRAFTVAPALGIASVLLQQWGPLVVLPLTLGIAYTGIVFVYDLSYKLAGLVTLVYYTLVVIFAFTVYNVITLLGTAPA